MASSAENRSATAIIDSIVNVTAQPNRDLIEMGLVSTLYELIKVDKISLSQLVRNKIQLKLEINPNKIEIEEMSNEKRDLILEEALHFKRCHDTAEKIAIPTNNTTLHIYPMLNIKNEVSGFLELVTDKLSEADAILMEGLLRIYRNYMHILEESEIDTLTGLLNRRTFDRNLDQLLSQTPAIEIKQKNYKIHTPKRRTEKTGGQNWIAVLDIDFFKKINDKYGHLYGDEVLLLMSSIMLSCFRQTDKLFRFGGEEFVIIIKSTTTEGAGYALERLRKKIAKYDFPQVGHVTVSIGFIEVSNNCVPSEVLSKADEALYFAKDHGRNQIHNYEELVAEGKIIPTTIEVNDDIELF